MDGEEMRKNKEYIIAGSLLSLAIVGMVFAYNTESGDKKAQEQQEQQIAFQEVEKDKEEAKDEVEDVSNILEAKQKEEQKAEEAKAKEEEKQQEEEKETEETASAPEALHFQESLTWPTDGNVLMNYSMDQTVYFASLDQYRYNPAVIIGAEVNNQVNAAAAGNILDISNNEETGCTVTMDLGDGYKAVYGQLKEVQGNVGDYIGADQVLGFVNEPTKYYSQEGGNLYFKLLKDDQPVDPMAYFQ